MTEKSGKTGKKQAGRDAYDDFLNEKKTTSSKSASKRKESVSDNKKKRTASSTVVKRAASSKKNGGESSKTSAPKKKTVKVEEGIVSLGTRQNVGKYKTPKTVGNEALKGAKRNAGIQTINAKKNVASTSGKSNTSKKNDGVMAIDNPVLLREAISIKKSSKDDFFMEQSSRMNSRNKKKYVTREKKSSKRNRRTKGKKSPLRLNGLDVFFSLSIIGMLALIVLQSARYSNFLMMKNAVDRQTYYDGTTIDGIDVSGMTLEAALNYWKDNIEAQYASRTISLDNGNTVSADELGYSSDYEMVLANAWSAGRSGSLEERYAAISNRQNTPVAYTISRTAYNDAAIEQYVQTVAGQVNTTATEASIESFDMSSYKFIFSDPKPGSQLDEEALKKSIKQALDAGGGEVKMVMNVIEPTTTKESIETQYGMIASAVTNASSSSNNRLQNIKLSMQFINGTCLKPGETFSFNEVVGQRTKDRGFKEATAYSSGEVTEQVGGGICQVSTTLFNAAVKADLQIDERHNHSLTVAYVDRGKDAAVNWGSQDLRFTNTSEDDIYICCYLTGDKRVRFGIFGKLLKNGETISVEGVTTGTINYETEYQASGLLASGEQQVLQTGKNGYTAETYKIRWDSNGNKISSELLCKSRYMAKKQIIQYGP